MPRYAADTSVTVERSRAEIEGTLKRYGACEFHSSWKEEAALIAFRWKHLFVRFILPFPARSDKRFTHKPRRGYTVRMTAQQTEQAIEQDRRSRWRALLLVIKAKLEAVECGISTMEEEFLAHIVMPNDMSVGEWLASEALPSIRAGRMPPLALPPPRTDVIDAEVLEGER